MASYPLVAFERVDELAVISAIEDVKKTQLHVAFWVNDPNQAVLYPSTIAEPIRQDELWQHTCFELFIGLKQRDEYREINLAPSGAWQAYAFEEYRYPDSMLPVWANDIVLVDLQRTRYGINATLDLNTWLEPYNMTFHDIYVGTTAVIETAEKTHYFAMQHSGKHADFHNKRDWLHTF